MTWEWLEFLPCEILHVKTASCVNKNLVYLLTWEWLEFQSCERVPVETASCVEIGSTITHWDVWLHTPTPTLTRWSTRGTWRTTTARKKRRRKLEIDWCRLHGNASDVIIIWSGPPMLTRLNAIWLPNDYNWNIDFSSVLIAKHFLKKNLGKKSQNFIGRNLKSPSWNSHFFL